MPQFDFYSFSGQNFWILLSFFIFYFFISYFYLANFSEMFKMRQKLATIFTTTVSSVNSFNFNLYDFFFKGSKI
jgi:hypothetical protein